MSLDRIWIIASIGYGIAGAAAMAAGAAAPGTGATTASDPFDGDWANPATVAAPARPAYTDRLIDNGGLKPLPLEADGDIVASSAGRPRSLVVEASGAVVSPSTDAVVPTLFQDRRTSDAGLTISGRYDSGNWGILGVDGTLRYGNFTSGLLFAPGGTGVAAGNDAVVGGGLTLRAEHVPLAGAAEVDALAGVVPRGTISLNASQTRFFLPAAALLGGDLTWRSDSGPADGRHVEPRLSANLSVGEPGLAGGFRLPTFVGLGGIEADAGVQWRPRPGLAAGVQGIVAHNVRDTIATAFDIGGVPRLSGEAVFAAASAGGADWRVQANILHSDTRRPDTPVPATAPGGALATLTDIFGPGEANGAWADAVLDHGRVAQSLGLFYLDPRLAWGASPLPADAWGGYYRVDYRRAARQIFGSIDVSRSVSGEGLNTAYADLGLRQRLSPVGDAAIGLEAAVRRADAGSRIAALPGFGGSTTTQVTGYGEATTLLGPSRVEGSYAFDMRADILQLSATQTWHLLPAALGGLRLSTQIFYDRQHERQIDGSRSSSSGIGGSVTAGGHLLPRVDLDATIAYGGTSDGAAGANTAAQLASAPAGLLANVAVYSPFVAQRGTNFAATANLFVQLATRWSLTASFTDSESRTQLNTYAGDVGTLARAIATESTYRLVSGTLAVRYSFAAGRAAAPIGTASRGGGWGRISGRVFMDATRRGGSALSQSGLGGVTIVLDGRFTVQTDAAGWFRFDQVATGPHTLTAPPDALPLPWHYAATPQTGDGAGEFRREVMVDVRQTADVDIAVVR